MKKWMVPLLLTSSLGLITACGTGNGNSPKKPVISSSAEFKKDDYKKIVASQNQLGFDLLPEVKANEAGNTFISPTSLFMALSMIYNGADGVTKEEMAKVLHAEGIDAGELDKANASLTSMLKNDSKHIQLRVANSIWLNNRFHFQKNFSQQTKDFFNAEIKEMDPTKSQSPKMINDWVNKSTNGKIKKIVEAPLDNDLVAILINAIYFKGDWMHEFDKNITENRTFYMADGNTKNVPLMTLNERLEYLENADFQAVNLPYAGGKMSMTVFLTKEDSSLKDFSKMLTSDKWLKWRKGFEEKEGTILLPKFTMEYETKLEDVLMKLGMKTAFDPDANFTKMIQEKDPLWISEIKQKTYIDVNEKGTEAAAVTSGEMKTTSAPADGSFHMEVNRPFFYTITDNETEAILFMGAIANP